jgi:hypothetical protein
MKTNKCRNYIQPKVIQRGTNHEVWLFRNQYFRAFIFSDGVVQLRVAWENPSAKGHWMDNGCAAINSHNGHDREAAIKWLNENVG